MTGTLLALDLSSRTGWAIAPMDATVPSPLEAAAGARPSVEVEYGTFRVGRPNAPLGEALSCYRAWIYRMLTRHRVALCVFEAPVIPPGSKLNLATLRKLYCLAGLTEEACHETGPTRCMEAHQQQVRKHFVGHMPREIKTAERKRLVIEACRLRGWEPSDDNAADALAVLSYSLDCLAAGRRRAAA